MILLLLIQKIVTFIEKLNKYNIFPTIQESVFVDVDLYEKLQTAIPACRADKV
jgi:hypothetical protein